MDQQPTEPQRQGYPLWAWIIGILTFWPLPGMLVGRFIPQTRQFFRAPGIILSAVAFFMVFVMFAIIVAVASPSPESQANSSRPERAKVQVPIATPIPTPIPGLGVSRREIQSLFEKSAINFTFEDSPLANGTPRLLGQSPDGLAILDLIGPQSNLTNVAMMVFVPSDAPDVIVKNSAYLLGLLNNTLPDWSGGTDWMTDNIPVAQRRGEVQTSYGNAVVTLSVIPELGMLTLSINAE